MSSPNTPLTVMAFLPSGFPDNNSIRVGEDNYDSLSEDATYIYDEFGPRPQNQTPF